MIIFDGKYTKAKVMIDQIDESCSAQITQFINHPAFTNPVTIMPDCHAGKGSVIGFTMEMTDKIIPNTVGVDIGCGMLSINVGKNIFSKLNKKDIDRKIREAIPFGYDVHNKEIHSPKAMGWSKLQILARNFASSFNNKFGTSIKPPEYNYDWYEQNCKNIGVDFSRVVRSIGSLGGGNHFIEIGVSNDTGDYWLTVHSGSRNYGKVVADYWQKVAKSKTERKRSITFQDKLNKIRLEYKGKDIQNKIEEVRSRLGLSGRLDRGLEYLEGSSMAGYLFDMIFAQNYAHINRSTIASIITNDVLECGADDIIECVHNYIDFSDLIIRKGAISSYKNSPRIVIPLNMRDGLLICKGKGNSEWNYSAPHGAGRVLSRSQAKAKLDLEEFQKQMRGVFSTSIVKATIDEAPDAYKDSKVIEAAIEPTAEIIDKVIPIHNMKDNGESPRYGKNK